MSTFPRQKRLNWYEHVGRREEDNLSGKMVHMVVPEKRRRGWPRRRWIENTREGMKGGGAGRKTILLIFNPAISLYIYYDQYEKIWR